MSIVHIFPTAVTAARFLNAAIASSGAGVSWHPRRECLHDAHKYLSELMRLLHRGPSYQDALEALPLPRIEYANLPPTQSAAQWLVRLNELLCNFPTSMQNLATAALFCAEMAERYQSPETHAHLQKHPTPL